MSKQYKKKKELKKISSRTKSISDQKMDSRIGHNGKDN